METLTQFLIDWGYWGLFFSALIAGSVVPFSSEAVMLVLVHMGLDPVLCIVSAASGNTLGGMSCYWIVTSFLTLSVLWIIGSTTPTSRAIISSAAPATGYARNMVCP